MKKLKDLQKEMKKPCKTCKQVKCGCEMNEAVVDKSEVGYKGEMAISQAKQIRHHLEELMSVLKVDTDLPEWVSSKMTLAADYVQTVSDYLLAHNMKEDAELEEKRGLWDNIHAKQERIKHGSGEHMRKPGSKGAPTKADLEASQSKK
jgi:hypothetical protein